MRLKFRLSNGKKTFFQWDVNQKIILENPICTQVHFENKDISDKAYVKEVYKDEEGRSVVDIPDIFLQYTPGFSFYGYVISEDGKARFTEERGDVSVIRRAKPSDYVFTPEDQKTLEEVFDNAVKYVPEEKTDEEKANARENIEAEFKGNKVDSIGDDADGKHYPSTKAVKDYVRDSAVQADVEELDTTSPSFIKNNPFKPAKTWEETLRKSTYKNSDTYNGMQVYEYYFYNNQLGDRKFILKVNDAITYNIEPTFDALKNALTQNGTVWLETRYSYIRFAASESDDIHLYQSYYQLDPRTLPPANMEGSYPATPGGFVCDDIDTKYEDINNYARCKFYHSDDRLSYPWLYAPKTVKTYDKFDNLQEVAASNKGDIFWYLNTGDITDSMGLTDADMPIMCYCTYSVSGSAFKNTKFYIETAIGRRFRTYLSQYDGGKKKWTTCEEITPSSTSSIILYKYYDENRNVAIGYNTEDLDKIGRADSEFASILLRGDDGDLYSLLSCAYDYKRQCLVLSFDDTLNYKIHMIDMVHTDDGYTLTYYETTYRNYETPYKVEKEIVVGANSSIASLNNSDIASFPSFTVGDTVDITVNGTKYSLTAYTPADALPTIAAIGDDPTTENPEYGWILLTNGDRVTFGNNTDAEMTIQFIGVTGEMAINPKYIKDMYYETEGSDITGYSITIGVVNSETTHDEIPFEMGQKWSIYYNDTNLYEENVEVQKTSDGMLYIGSYPTPAPYYVTKTASRILQTWQDNSQVDNLKLVCTKSAKEIKTIPIKYLPSEVLTKTNEAEYTPTEDYNPATKKYVDDSIKQPDWYEFDKTNPAYIKNKPFEDNVVDITGDVSNDKSTLYLTELKDKNNKYLYYVDGKYSDDETILSENGLSVKKSYSGTKSVVKKSSTSVIDLNNVKVYRIDSFTTIPWHYLPLGTEDKTKFYEGGEQGNRGIFMAARWDNTDPPSLSNLQPCYYYEFDDSYSLWVKKELKVFSNFTFNSNALGHYDKYQICYSTAIGDACTELGITEDDLPIMSYLMSYTTGDPPVATYFIETATNKRFKATYKFGTSAWSYIKKLNSGSSAFYINVSSTTDDSGNTTYSVDKTAAEIYEAVSSNVVMYAVVKNSASAQSPDNDYLLLYRYNANTNQNTGKTAIALHFKGDTQTFDINLSHSDSETTLTSLGLQNIVSSAIFMKLDNEDGSTTVALNADPLDVFFGENVIPVVLRDRSAEYRISNIIYNNIGVVCYFEDIGGKKIHKVTIDMDELTLSYSEETVDTSASITYDEQTGNLQIGG